MAQEDGTTLCRWPCEWRSSSGVWGSVPAGEGSFAQVIMKGFLTLAQAALTALGPVRRNSGVDNF
jgi:hypothetical protein